MIFRKNMSTDFIDITGSIAIYVFRLGALPAFEWI